MINSYWFFSNSVYSTVQNKLISSEIVPWLCIFFVIIQGNDCQISDLFIALIKNKLCVVLVLGILLIARQGKATGMVFLLSSKNQNSSYWGKFWSRETKFSLS